MARGELRCIGATTLDEYRKYIEKDAALERRFQPVYVNEPSVEDTIAILRGLKPRYEAHHSGVKIKDSALVAAANFRTATSPTVFCPTRRSTWWTRPPAAWRWNCKACRRRSTRCSGGWCSWSWPTGNWPTRQKSTPSERREEIQQEMTDLRRKLADLRKQWGLEKSGLGDVAPNSQQARRGASWSSTSSSAAIKEKQSAGMPVDEADYQKLYELDMQRQAARRASSNRPTSRRPPASGRRLLRREVGPEEIAEVVSAWTGIPVSRMMETERAKLLVMEERIHQRMVDQDEAVAAVSNAVRRNRSGLQDPNRPIGSFIFLVRRASARPSCARPWPRCMFDDENAMVRLDMSEFMERHTVSRLIGAPPGYVGYEEGGRLTEAVRRRPYCGGAAGRNRKGPSRRVQHPACKFWTTAA